MARGGFIVLNPDRGPAVTLLVSQEPEREGGVGGWTSTDRALRRPAKWFNGQPDDTMNLTGILDIDAHVGPSIETRLLRLRMMGLPSGPDHEPPKIKVSGDVWDHDRTLTWVVSGLSFGARLYNADGTLRRHTVTVNLERFNGLDEIEPLRIRATRQHGHRRRHTVVSKAGDTLRAVSLRELGSAGRWKDLRKWNKKLKKVDPDVRLRTGTHISIR